VVHCFSTCSSAGTGCLVLAFRHQPWLTAKTAVAVVRADDVAYEVASAPKPGDLLLDRYNKPYFEVVTATYMPFMYRTQDEQGNVVYSPDPQRYTMLVTIKTIAPFYDDVPVMAKQRIVVGVHSRWKAQTGRCMDA